MAKKARKKPEEGVVEANLIPVLSCMFLLIPALLLAMEVAHAAVIHVRPPSFCSGCDTPEPVEPTEPLLFSVMIREDGFVAKTGNSANRNEINIPLAADGNHDFAALEAKARDLKARFPHEAMVTVSAEGSIPMQTLVGSLDALRGQECSLAGTAVGEGAGEGCYFWDAVVSESTG